MSYKKKINTNAAVDMFYDEDIGYAFVVGLNTIHTVRNDKLNNFTVTSSLSFEKFPEIVRARYNSHQKYLLSLTNTQEFMIINL